MSIPELNKNVWGQVALFLEEVHPFAQASRACKQIALESFYPAFWNAYLKLRYVRPYAEKLEHLPDSAAKVCALFASFLKEIRSMGNGEEHLAILAKPLCSLKPVRLEKLAEHITRVNDTDLVWMFKSEHLKTLTPFLENVEWSNEYDDLAEKADEVRSWIRVNRRKLSAIAELSIFNVSMARVPDQIALFGSLTVLDLSANYLVSIPESISNLIWLRRLGLRDNSLSTLPLHMGKLRQLQALDLAKNSFAVVPDVVYTLSNLTALNLSGNKLTNISSAIASLTKLNVLGLIGNELTTLPTEMRHLRQLKSLSLSFIKAVPKALKESDIPAIRDNPYIRAAETIEPTLCERISEFFWRIWTWVLEAMTKVSRWFS